MLRTYTQDFTVLLKIEIASALAVLKNWKKFFASFSLGIIMSFFLGVRPFRAWLCLKALIKMSMKRLDKLAAWSHFSTSCNFQSRCNFFISWCFESRRVCGLMTSLYQSKVACVAPGMRLCPLILSILSCCNRILCARSHQILNTWAIFLVSFKLIGPPFCCCRMQLSNLCT